MKNIQRYTSFRWSLETLLIAILYAGAGMIGQLMAIPPGNVTLVWPPSGIALAVVLMLGYRSLFGIWLGAFIGNTWAFFNSTSVMNAILVGSTIGIGSFLQSLFGFFLFHRLSIHEGGFDNILKVLKFLGVVPLMCLVSASIGTTSLSVGGLVSWEAYANTWITWWIGDSLGVLVIIPLFFIWIAELGNASIQKKLSIIIPLSIAISLTVIMFFNVRDEELQDFQSEFEQQVNVIGLTLNEAIATHFVNIIYSIRWIFTSNSQINRQAFHLLTQEILSHHSITTQALEWVPRVSHEQRLSFENQAKLGIYADFHLKEQNKWGEMIPAQQRPEYFPVYYLEPYKGNESALGFDLGSNPERLEALHQARDTNQLIASPPITLVQETGKQLGFLLIAPVYEHQSSHETLDQRRRNLKGFVLGVFRANELITNSLKAFSENNIVYRVYDETTPNQKCLITDYYKGQSGISFDVNQIENSPFQSKATIEVGGRLWTINGFATPAYLSTKVFWRSKILLPGGLLFSSLLGLFLLILVGRSAMTEQLIAERTAELAITNRELKKSTEKAESANHAKSEFLSNMSHELRTPLNGILGYTQILKRDRNLNTMQMDSINIIHQSGKHLLTLINDILDLSKIEARKMELYPTDVHFQTFIEGIVGIIRMRAEEKNVLFKVEIPTPLPSGVNVDEKRLRQILINLLGNAVKFTEQGAVILRVSTLGRLQVTGDIKTQNFCFEVEDHGVGMDPEELDQIFLPFEQVGAKEARQAGTGLGLAISRQLVEMMGGELQVKSEKGKGSWFWFEITLPVVEVTNHLEPVISQPVTGYKGKRRTILVVDDKQNNRLMLLNMLEPLGFQIILAKDGQEEIDKAKELQPDIILTDLVMPVKTGFEAVQEIRDTPVLKEIPIIAVSASVFDMDQTKSQVMGCNAFLPKPVEEGQLFALLSKYMDLTWIYEAQTPTEVESPAKVDEEQPLVAPPTEDLEVLYELAMLGSMRDIRDKASQLKESDDKYIPFAHQLQSLAKGFEDEKIVAFIEQYLEVGK